MGKRIGQFFFLVGLLIMFVFSASFANGSPYFNLFLIGMALISLGIFMMIRNRKPRSESERFRRMRKLRKKK
ncbi:MAG TPA: hypothetical protein DEH25_11915 [Chloroflexi bacterium]|nr:hypothetical protein [Chloroflexota bacterium]